MKKNTKRKAKKATKTLFIYFNSAKRLSSKKKNSLANAALMTIAAKTNLSTSDFSVLTKDATLKEINSEHKKSIKMKYPHIAIYQNMKSSSPTCLGVTFHKKK